MRSTKTALRQHTGYPDKVCITIFSKIMQGSHLVLPDSQHTTTRHSKLTIANYCVVLINNTTLTIQFDLEV